jgi:hypothetical protein
VGRGFGLKQLMTSWGFVNQPNKTRNIPIIACEVLEGFSDYMEADIHESLGSHTDEITQEHLEKLICSVYQNTKKILTLL